MKATVWREDDWFVAQCLQIDIASQGRTEAEALANLREALELFFEYADEEEIQRRFHPDLSIVDVAVA